METLLAINILIIYLLLGVACFAYMDLTGSIISQILTTLYSTSFIMIIIVVVRNDLYYFYDFINRLFLIGWM